MDSLHGEGCRNLFALDFANFTHINHGSYGTAPLAVISAVANNNLMLEAFPDDFFRRKGFKRWTEICDRLEDDYNLPRGSAVFIPNATYAVNTVLFSLKINPGDVLIFTNHTYRACRNAILAHCEKFGAIPYCLEIPLPCSNSDIVKILSTALEKLNNESKNVKFLLIDHITSPTNFIMPVQQLCDVAHGYSVPVMIDGAHAPNQLDLTNGSITCADYYCGNLHKWAWAPKGTALFYTSPQFQASTVSYPISHFHYQAYRHRFFMVGTRNFTEYLSYDSNSRRFEESLGGHQLVYKFNTELASRAATLLADRWGTSTLYDRSNYANVSAPFLCGGDERLVEAPYMAVLELPFSWAEFCGNPDINEAWVPITASGLEGRSLEWQEAAIAKDGNINERVAATIFELSAIQSQVFTWLIGGKIRLLTRLSAQVYNTMSDYERYGSSVEKLLEFVKSQSVPFSFREPI